MLVDNNRADMQDSVTPKAGGNQVDNLLDIAWGIIANVSEGDWGKQPAEWIEAASRWRESYHNYLDQRAIKAIEAVTVARRPIK